MPRVRVDLSNAIDAVPDGIYNVTIVSYKQATKPGGEYPYILWKYNIDDGEYSGVPIFDVTSLSPASGYRMKEFLVAAGEHVPDRTKDFEFDPDDLIGRSLALQISVSTDDSGRKTNDVVAYIHPSGLSGHEMVETSREEGRRPRR